MKTENNTRKKITFGRWYVNTVVLIFVLLFSIMAINVIMDPYFHYHKPFTKYRLINERYINDGIARNFDYDAIVLGNSLAQNYKCSQFDDLYDVNSIKLPYSGAGMKELWLALGRAIGREAVNIDTDVPAWEYGFGPEDIDTDDYRYQKGYNRGVSRVMITMDIEDIMLPFYWSRYKDYPKYMSDDNVINDVSYLFSKDVLYKGSMYNVLMTLCDRESTTFDEYSSWTHECGKDKVMSYLDRYDTLNNRHTWELEGYEKVKLDQMLDYNMIPVIKANPNIDFMIVLPPRSIAKWAEYNVEGGVDFRIDGMNYVISVLAEYDNVHIFGFDDEYELVTDFNRFSDLIHYDKEVNEWMLNEMSLGHHTITKDNYSTYIDSIRQFYSEYDYAALRS